MIRNVWQVQAIEWLRQMEASPIKGGICGYDMGLGKTVIACGHILIQTTLKEQKMQEKAKGKGKLTVRVKPLKTVTAFTREPWKPSAVRVQKERKRNER